MNRRNSPEEELRTGWIGARHFWVVQRAGLGCVQPAERRVARNDDVRVITEALHVAIPNISMNVIIFTRRRQ